jgi:hypothetical protein
MKGEMMIALIIVYWFVGCLATVKLAKLLA